jgi:hypothetical protein
MVKSGLKILLDALKGQGLTNPDDFQVGKTKLFMRDKQVRPFIAFLLCALPRVAKRLTQHPLYTVRQIGRAQADYAQGPCDHSAKGVFPSKRMGKAVSDSRTQIFLRASHHWLAALAGIQGA